MFAEKYLFASLSLTIGLLVLQAGLISALLVKRGRQRWAMNERRESEQRLAELTGLLLRTQDEERRRIALELLPRNGAGFESIGVGIPGMRHRLKQLGGELLVDSNAQGTIVTATVPVRGGPQKAQKHEPV
jgi:signal transduction histidine kinase